jgi:hypothetical protein
MMNVDVRVMYYWCVTRSCGKESRPLCVGVDGHGVRIYIPLARKSSYEESHTLAFAFVCKGAD